MNSLMTDAGVELLPDPSRVVAKLFVPGEATPGGSSRTQDVLDRALNLPRSQVARIASSVLESCGPRHHQLEKILRANARSVHQPSVPLSPDLELVVGAVFSAEFSVEGAALCNPSAVAHHDQSGLAPGQLRAAVALRAIGEGHYSSIEFAEAIIGPGRQWRFEPRDHPLTTARIDHGHWTREHFVRALQNRGRTEELARSVALELPQNFDNSAVERVLQTMPASFLRHPEAREQQEMIRIVTGSAYTAQFAEDSTLSQRVLLPTAYEENRGVEDLRLVRFTDQHGRVDYRGNYTAYNGHAISSRLVTSTDLRDVAVHRLTGPPTQTKGMALFPRLVDGKFLALARGDGETISVTTSEDGLDWSQEEPILGPRHAWDIVQSGNCGSPIETEAGWLVLTHGVGPFRRYAIGAILLDLQHPERVIGAIDRPLLEPGPDSDGYVPAVVYSCGGLVHDQVLWLPYGIADQRIRVASISLPELLSTLVAQGA